MSLKVWLPLNGNLKNKGASDITIINNGATIDNNGKIGKCYSFNGNSSYLLGSNPPLNNNSLEWSYACWFKPNTAHNGCLYSNRNSVAATGITIFYYTNNFLIDDGVRWQFTPSTAIKVGAWNHLTIVRKANGYKKCYLNGELINTTTTTGTPTIATTTNFSIGGSQTSATNVDGNFFNGYINDVRIYDHCLSVKEIKEISQGLILHYKLDNESLEATTNLLSTAQSCEHWTSINLGQYVGSLSPATCVCGNNKITYSAYIDNTSNVDTNVRCSPLLVAGSYGTFQGNIIPAGSKGWSSVTVDITDSTKYTGTIYVYFQNQSSGTVPTSPTIRVKYAQVEAKDHRTSWVKGGSTRTPKTIDSSGYGNHGVANALSITNNSPRYSTGVVFNGSSSYVKVTDNNWLSQGMEAMTINLWAKSSAWASTHLFSCTESGGFNTEAGNSGYLRFPVRVYTNSAKTTSAYKYDSTEIQISALSTTEWNMLTWVYDLSGTKTYINGALHHTYTNTSYGIYFNTNARLFLGCEANTANPSSPYFNGQMSDFRLYTTALSPEDIKALYNTPTWIDKNNSWHTYKFYEDNKNEISKNGLVHSGEFSEAVFTEYLKYDPNIYIEPDGSAWVHIYHHDHPNLGSFASGDSFTTSIKKDDNRWFNATEICNRINKWEFLIKYCFTENGTIYKERWVQTKNPEVAVFGDVDAADITRITEGGYKTGTWGGLYRKNSSAYWVMNNANSGNWWGATGSFSIYQGGIPGYGGSITTTGYNDLYVRIDNVDFLNVNEVKITKNNIYLGNNLIEI